MLAEIGAKLRRKGLSPEALARWVGSTRLSALPALLAHRTGHAPLLELFVAGEDVPAGEVPFLAALAERELVEVAGERAHARASILPLGESLLVCDRLDTDDSLDIVCWPDDSSYHLAQCLPPTAPIWLDLGCGSAFATLFRPALARMVTVADLNPRAVRYAGLGLALSGVAPVLCVESDLGDGLPRGLRATCNLVTCNAPIPEPTGAPYRARWRLTDATFVERLFAHARAFLARGGMVVVHAVLDALEPVVAELPGERAVIAYTPEGVRGFAVAWWCPDAEPRLVRARRPLTESRPHLTYEDRLAALAGTLSPL